MDTTEIDRINAKLAETGRKLTSEQEAMLRARPNAHTEPILAQLAYVISGQKGIVYPFATTMLQEAEILR